LDLILSFAGPRAQVVALDVSEVWRDSAISGISSRKNLDGFCFSVPCEPIEYGYPIDPDGAESRPSIDEIKNFGVQPHSLIERQRRTLGPLGYKYLYFPARFTQIRDLPDDIAQALDALDIEQKHDFQFGVVSSPRDTATFWLDLSQVQINPYFDCLFTHNNRIKHHLGRWEITLRPHPSDMILEILPI
jgi:hypothetical protein